MKAAVSTSAPGAEADSAGRLAVGGAADLCLWDPQDHWQVSGATLRSQSSYTPFGGHEMQGRVRATLVGGQVVHELPSAADAPACGCACQCGAA